ncbi:MAG TPA: hypothetical protein VK886_15580 [Vicinamibacterales bacterium]|nr:hypothetical protein [Vicinamibacterales bacterium]
MGVIDTVKDVALLVQKLDNMDLLKRMVELQEQVFELVNENREIREQNRVLSEKLMTREQMSFRKNSYWRGEEGPFCSRCFDAEGLAVRMLKQPGYLPKCPKCDTLAPDPDGRGPRL